MIPYYDHAGITIYHADCRDILPHLEPMDLVLTDPPYGIGFAEYESYRDKEADYRSFLWPIIETCEAKVISGVKRLGRDNLHLLEDLGVK